VSAATPIGPGTRVVLFFTLRLDNGDLIDSTGDRAAEFVFGDGKLLPGFEAVLVGLTKGHKETFHLEPEQGFGLVNPDNIHVLKRPTLRESYYWSPGLWSLLWTSSSKASCQALSEKCLRRLWRLILTIRLRGR